jgi:hypothetical protein
MSGTRKMEKFELDAYTQKSRSPSSSGDEAPPPSSKKEQDEKEAAAAIAEISPNALDALGGSNADLPARPFDQRREPAVASAELPSVPFEARKPPTMIEPTDLPDVPFAQSNLPALAFEPRAAAAVESGESGTAAEEGDDDSPSAKARAAHAASQPWEPGEWVPPQAATPAAEADAGAATGEAPTSGGPDALRTKLAQKFVTLADSVGESFRDFAIGAGAWAVELTAPQGMSTGGGKQALQHLRLRPRREGYSVLVAGTVNQLEKRAELRDFDHVTILHEVRYRNALEVSRQEWEQFLRKAEVVLNGAGIQSMRTPPPRDLLEQRRNMQRISKGAIVALIVVLALAIVVVWRVVVALSAQQ